MTSQDSGSSGRSSMVGCNAYVRTLAAWFLVGCGMVPVATAQDAAKPAATAKGPAKEPASSGERSESTFLSEVRQLTFEGARAGEGYFSRDGRYMVFQSEREPSNPFYQIYLMDRETGDVEKVSPGYGKTTCAWIHPEGDRVLFASTQQDPEAITKQKKELEFRASGQQRRYAWDYDPQFDLIEWNRTTGQYRNLTQAPGYDAEASYSPDGSLIAFSSNRAAYEKPLSDREKTLFEQDPAVALDLYVMQSDGSNVRRITDVFGYDGGPFFSPDGKRLCWRRFSEDGATAEIYSANIDGSDAKRLTQLGAMSWAPYFHPSGDYLIFATNLQGFANFELYLVDAAGTSEPVRVTTTEGFDGLPVFTPDGKELAWTSNRTADKKSQIFLATWNDAAARAALGIGAASDRIKDTMGAGAVGANAPVVDREGLVAAASAARSVAAETDMDYKASDVGRHIDYLCRPELGGRLTGTEGERLATAYVAGYMSSLGLEPAGNRSLFELHSTSNSPSTRLPSAEDTQRGDPAERFFFPFPYTSGVRLQSSNLLQSDSDSWTLDEDWRPLAFSKSTSIEPTEVVFAGYGIVAPADAGQPEYDSYVHLDVENKWVMVLRQMPADVSPERRQHLARYSSLRFKAMVARDRGAKGLIIVSGPKSGVRQQLVPLQGDGSLSGTSIAAISVTDAVAEKWFAKADDRLGDLQSELDRGELMMGFELPDVKVRATIDVQPIQGTGVNVLGVLRASDDPKQAARSMIIIGAHIDHLGAGANNSSSLAREEERAGVHRGADDNASGVAAMLEIAQSLASQKKSGKLQLKHDVLFAAWSGEEMGLLGSAYFADHFYELYPALPKGDDHRLYPAVVACFNLDMVGRLRDNLVLQGIGSSPYWKGEIERRNAVVGLPVTLQNDSYLPTDASTFFLKGIPILSAFTGSHSEYHTPRDTPELINYEGAAKIAKLMGLIARSVAISETIPEYTEQQAPENQGVRAAMTAYLGSIPDYAQGDIQGVLLSGVSKDGPAAKAGVQAKDIVIELAGRKVENIYDYTYAIEALKVGQETEIVVRRGETTHRFKVVPQSRQ